MESMNKQNERLDSRSKRLDITSIESSETGIMLARNTSYSEKGSHAGRDGWGTPNTSSDLRDAPLAVRNEMAQSSNVVFPRKLLKKFILMYRELNCLWDRKCLTYKHKKKRHDAVTKLTELVQKYDSSATRVHVLRKIESLRACVRREYKKIQDSRLQATSPDEVYTPHLWYYDMLSFVFGEEESNLKQKQESPEPVISESEDEIVTREPDEAFQPPIVNYSDYTVTTNLMEGENVSPIPKPFAFEEDKSKRHCTEVDDEYDAIGINVAAKLRGLPSNMRILAEKLINDVLYQAQMNSLNSTTVITTPDPFKQDVL